ncbi:hypothetical protein AX14_002154, partial [Amanita brunnescens Koide BX004]
MPPAKTAKSVPKHKVQKSVEVIELDDNSSSVAELSMEPHLAISTPAKLTPAKQKTRTSDAIELSDKPLSRVVKKTRVATSSPAGPADMDSENEQDAVDVTTTK